jgi:hypothetical protein
MGRVWIYVTKLKWKSGARSGLEKDMSSRAPKSNRKVCNNHQHVPVHFMAGATDGVLNGLETHKSEYVCGGREEKPMLLS